MLFEVFFDPDARLRNDFKLRVFSELFELQRHKEFQSSFDFIAEWGWNFSPASAPIRGQCAWNPRLS